MFGPLIMAAVPEGEAAAVSTTVDDKITVESI
jgi:hypothetical protein